MITIAGLVAGLVLGAPSNQFLYVANGRFRLHDLRTGSSSVLRIAGCGERPAWSHDGRLLAYVTAWGDCAGPHLSPYRIVVQDLHGHRKTFGFGKIDAQHRGWPLSGTPQWSSGDRYLAVAGWKYVGVVDLKSGQRSIIRGARHPTWSPSGRLTYVRGATIWTAGPHGTTRRALVRRLSFEGRPACLEDIAWAPDGAHLAYGLTDNCDPINLAEAQVGWTYVLSTRTHAIRMLPAKGQRIAWSPDGRSVAIGATEHEHYVAVFSTSGRAIGGWGPEGVGSWAWTTDSAWLAYLGRDGQVWRRRPTGTGRARIIVGKTGFGSIYNSADVLAWRPR